MTTKELTQNLTAVRSELERLSVTGVQAARSIAGMANVLDQCIAGVDGMKVEKEADNGNVHHES